MVINIYGRGPALANRSHRWPPVLELTKTLLVFRLRRRLEAHVPPPLRDCKNFPAGTIIDIMLMLTEPANSS